MKDYRQRLKTLPRSVARGGESGDRVIARDRVIVLIPSLRSTPPNILPFQLRALLRSPDHPMNRSPDLTPSLRSGFQQRKDITNESQELRRSIPYLSHCFNAHVGAPTSGAGSKPA